MLSWSFKYIQMHFTISGSNLLIPIRFKPTYLHYCISLLRGLSISMLDWTQASQTVLPHQAQVKPQIYSAFPCQICNFKENGPKVPHSLASHCVSDFIFPLFLAWLPSSLALTVSLTLRSAPGWALESVASHQVWLWPFLWLCGVLQAEPWSLLPPIKSGSDRFFDSAECSRLSLGVCWLSGMPFPSHMHALPPLLSQTLFRYFILNMALSDGRPDGHLMETTFPPLVIGHIFLFFFFVSEIYLRILFPVFPTSIEHSCLFCRSVYF